MRVIAALLVVIAVSTLTAAYRFRHDLARWEPDAAIYLRMALADRGASPAEAKTVSDRFMLTTSDATAPTSRGFYGPATPAYYADQFALFRTRPLFPQLGALLYPWFGPHGLQLISAVAYVLACVVLFFILLPLAPPWLAALGALALGTAPVVLEMSAYAMTDELALLFWTAALGAILAYQRRPGIGWRAAGDRGARADRGHLQERRTADDRAGRVRRAGHPAARDRPGAAGLDRGARRRDRRGTARHHAHGALAAHPAADRPRGRGARRARALPGTRGAPGLRGGVAVEREIVDTLSAFDALRPEWDELRRADRNATVFLSSPWLRAFLSMTPTPWSILTLRHSGRLVGAFPISLRNAPHRQVPIAREITFASEPFADYQGILSAPQHESAVVEAFASMVHALRWDRARFPDVQDERFAAIVERLAANGAAVERAPATPCSIIDLPDDWHTYLATLSKPTRRSTPVSYTH